MDAQSRRLVLLAAVALAAGALVYLFDRPPGTAQLLPLAASLGSGSRSWFGALGGSLPAGVHVYAFILLTVAVWPRPTSGGWACAGWWLVESLFELGQHAAVAPDVADALPAWLARVPVLENTAAYVLRGTFDPVDLAAITLGAVLAYLTLGINPAKEVGHGRSIQPGRHACPGTAPRRGHLAGPGDPHRQRRWR